MDRQQLATPAHFLLGIFITNDYTDGVPFYGLLSNAEIVQTFALDGLEGLNDQKRLRRLRQHVIQFLNTVHDNANEVQMIAENILLDDAKRRQRGVRGVCRAPLSMDGTNTASCTPNIHSPVKTIIQEVEMKKAKINWERFSRTQTSHTGPSAPASIDQAPPLYKKNPDSGRIKQIDTPKESTTSNNQPTTPAAKKKKKKLLGYHPDKTGHAALKKSFESVFATVTLTTGSVKGCLERATDLSTANVVLVAQRLDMAMSIVNTVKHFVYKMLEMRILRDLFPSPLQTTQGQAMVDKQTPFLEKILDSDWAEMVVGNLLSYVLRDSTSVRGPTTQKFKSQDALAEVMSIFANVKKLHPGSKALNPSDIPLDVVIDDLAPVVCLTMKLHYNDA
ncbi:hypothetical protein BGZ47_001972 [Haplosporangium gracile]|nr:hypothetical protein BGZ47_001972 [Haplosporangium gracile]